MHGPVYREYIWSLIERNKDLFLLTLTLLRPYDTFQSYSIESSQCAISFRLFDIQVKILIATCISSEIEGIRSDLSFRKKKSKYT